MLKHKKILIILAAVLTLTLAGLAVYYIFFKKTEGPSLPREEISSLTEELAPEAKERLIPITEEAVLAASLVGSNTATGTEKIIYAAWDGSVNQINYNGQDKNKIGLAAVERIGEVKISPNGELLSFRYGLATGLNRYLIYNIASRSLKTLPQNVMGVSFGPSSEILLLTSGSGGAKIIQSSADLSKNKEITTSKIPDLVLDWYNENSVALKTRPSGLAQGILYLLDLKTKKTKRVMGGVYGLTSNFSPSGKKVLISQTDADGFSLQAAAINLEKNTQRNLNLFTLPEKCAWSQDERVVFCSVIKADRAENYIMPDDYYKRRVRSNGEEVIRVNLETGQVQKIMANVFDATNLFLSPDESYLFFINKIDGRLYRLTL
ncbi:MAG: hypothetical protein AAB725_02305 [Patescibacteria group bacterium]